MNPASSFRAVTRRLSPEQAAALDLRRFAGDTGLLFVREGVGLAGRGEAFRVPLPSGASDVGHVAEVLRSLAVDDELKRAGSGPVAFAAIPFADNEPSSMIVPEWILAKSGDGTAWCTHIVTGPTSTDASASAANHAEFVLPDLVAPRTPGWSPHGFDLHSSVSHEQWCKIIGEAVTRIEDGVLDKVVLARSVDVVATNDFLIGEILGRLESLFPSCMVFSVEGFIGASPELLVSRKGSQVKTHPLAGTIARSGDPDTDAKLAAALLASTKDRWEHALVIDAIEAVLRPLCDELDVPRSPQVLPLRNVSHLATLITGSLAAKAVADHTAPTALELASLLHPTPAVGGVPRDRALAMIAELEPEPRGTYAGPVGWVDAAGNGEWAVGLRSARISGNTARMFAGGGIVIDSDPVAELQETQLKLQALLAAVVRP